MTKIKTAQAMGTIENGIARINNLGVGKVLTVVHGLTEAEVHEAAALLEKSQDVCEWQRDCFGRLCDCEGESHSTSKHSNWALVKFCPSCGRKVVVRE